MSIALIGLMFFISCSSSKDQINIGSLTSNQWSLVSISGKTLDANSLKSGLPYVTFFEGNVFKGFTGCNEFVGTYKYEDGKLSLDQGMITKMFCDDSPEMEFLSAVKKVIAYKISGNRLFLSDGTTILMEFIPKK